MTGLTYRDRDEERENRWQQEQLLAALDAAATQLRRDECGTWIITGRRGSIHTWGDGKTWVAYVRCRSPQHWTFTKRRLSFMTVTQDGDEEGCLRLFRLPSPQEAVVMRDVSGLRKRIDYAPDALERKRASMAKAGLARGTARASLRDVVMPNQVNQHFPAEGGLVVERAGILAGASVIAAGVKGRFRAQGAAMAPGLVPDMTPVPSDKESAAKAPINAVAVCEPEEAA